MSMKMSVFIEQRRKIKGLLLEDLCRAMNVSSNTYRSKLKKEGFTERQLLVAARLLEFDITFLPKEADIFTA